MDSTQAGSRPCPFPCITEPRVMLLSVWVDATASWHARVVTQDAHTYEFTSPFDLAQFLSRCARAPPPVSAVGLR